jgi:FkbH-like protein
MTAERYVEVLQRNTSLGTTMTGSPWPVRVLSNVTVHMVKEAIELPLRERGLNATVEIGNFDSIVADSASIGDAKAVVVMMDAGALVPSFHSRAALMDPAELAAVVESARAQVDLVLHNLRAAPLVVWAGFCALLQSAPGLRPSAFETAVQSLDAHLRAHAGENTVVVSLDRLVAEVGLEQAFDSRFHYASRAPYGWPLLRRFGQRMAPAALSAAGLARKVLVFDCDNTLWKGVLGEDGEDGIRMSDDTREGAPFADVQRIALALRRRGVLLGLCSKNNPGDVDAVLETHPDMQLRDADFAIKRVNWTDKATNLREIAAELNLGLDAIVFVDDSDFELTLVRDQLPQVHVVKVPADAHRYPALMREVESLFFGLSSTAEDSAKTEMYRQEAKRREAAQKHASMDDYLASLGLVVSLRLDDPAQVPRIAQMTQKTNQFNLTTKRYTEPAIRALIEGGRHRIATFRVADRFGDYGVTGLAIVALDPGGRSATLDTLLMSCRVLGRNIERVFFDRLAAILRQSGVEALHAEWVRTSKNALVENLCESLGFSVAGDAPGRKSYSMQLAQHRDADVGYIRVETEGTDGG